MIPQQGTFIVRGKAVRIVKHQVWRIIRHDGVAVVVRVVDVHEQPTWGGYRIRVHCRRLAQPNRPPCAYAISTFADPSRATLVGDAPDELAIPSLPSTRRSDGVPRRRVVRGPRGLQPVSGRQREAVALLRSGADRSEIAAKYGVARATLTDWIAKVENQEYEERVMA
jgi:hypothetical protein